MIDALGAGAAAAAYGRTAQAGQAVGASPGGAAGGETPSGRSSLGGGCSTCFDRSEVKVAEAGYEDAVRTALAKFCPASGDCGPDLPSKPAGVV